MDYVEKSFTQATEASKLLITLSTAVIAFCAAFVNVKIGESMVFTPVGTAHKWMLGLSMLGLLVSTACGVWTQLAIATVLREGTENAAQSISDMRIKFPFRGQILTFGVAVASLGAYAIARM